MRTQLPGLTWHLVCTEGEPQAPCCPPQHIMCYSLLERPFSRPASLCASLGLNDKLNHVPKGVIFFKAVSI